MADVVKGTGLGALKALGISAAVTAGASFTSGQITPGAIAAVVAIASLAAYELLPDAHST